GRTRAKRLNALRIRCAAYSPNRSGSHARIGWRRSHNGGTNMRQYLSKTTLAAIVLAAGVTAAAAQESIKVGVIQPLTGAFAASGNYGGNGGEDRGGEIQAKGGVVGKKMELGNEDNKNNPTGAAAVAEKLIVRDKVPVMMGAWGSGFTLAIMPKL